MSSFLDASIDGKIQPSYHWKMWKKLGLKTFFCNYSFYILTASSSTCLTATFLLSWDVAGFTWLWQYLTWETHANVWRLYSADLYEDNFFFYRNQCLRQSVLIPNGWGSIFSVINPSTWRYLFWNGRFCHGHISGFISMWMSVDFVGYVLARKPMCTWFSLFMLPPKSYLLSRSN